MTNAELLAKIKAEIEKQMKFYDEKEMKAWDDLERGDEDALWYQGHRKMCAKLLSFLSTLESEKPVPNDLEEAARLYAIPHYMKDIDLNHIEEYPYDTGLEAAFIAGAKWMAEHKQKDEQFPPLEGLDAIKAKYYDDGFKNGFDEGVVEGKRLMMEEAVEGDYDCQYMTPAVFLDKYLDGIKDGDKVRIIILPKED